MNEFTVVRKERAAKFTSKTTWDGEDSDYNDYGSSVITVQGGWKYTHPSGDCTVTIKPGSKVVFYVTHVVEHADKPYLIIDEAVCEGDWECMGRRNPMVLLEDFDNDREVALNELLVKGIYTLMMHAANYDGCEGSILTIDESTKHFGNFGIIYESHSIARAVKSYGY